MWCTVVCNNVPTWSCLLSDRTRDLNITVVEVGLLVLCIIYVKESEMKAEQIRRTPNVNSHYEGDMSDWNVFRIVMAASTWTCVKFRCMDIFIWVIHQFIKYRKHYNFLYIIHDNLWICLWFWATESAFYVVVRSTFVVISGGYW